MTKATKFLAGADGRTVPARHYRDLLNALILEYALTSEADISLARSLAIQSVWLEAETGRMANGEPVDTVMLTRASNAVRRLKDALERTTKARLRRARP